MNYIQRFLYGRKKRILLSDFAKEVKKIAKENNSYYYTVGIIYSHHIDTPKAKRNDEDLLFTCYIDGFSHCNGETMLESIDKMKSEIKKVSQKRKDQVIKEIVI